jgi:hypothetical protein
MFIPRGSASRLVCGIADHLAEVHMDQRVSAEKTLQSRLASARRVFSPSQSVTSALWGGRSPAMTGHAGYFRFVPCIRILLLYTPGIDYCL